MAVLLATGEYTVTRYAETYDAQGTGMQAGDTLGTVTVPGRVRGNAAGVDVTLDPACWPLAQPAAGIVVELAGPDPTGAAAVYVLRTAEPRIGQAGILRQLDHVQGYAEPATYYKPA